MGTNFTEWQNVLYFREFRNTLSSNLPAWPVNNDLFAQLANLNPGILKSLLTRHFETVKTSAEKSKEDTEDEGVNILTQIGVSKEDIEVV